MLQRNTVSDEELANPCCRTKHVAFKLRYSCAYRDLQTIGGNWSPNHSTRRVRLFLQLMEALISLPPPCSADQDRDAPSPLPEEVVIHTATRASKCGCRLNSDDSAGHGRPISGFETLGRWFMLTQ